MDSCCICGLDGNFSETDFSHNQGGYVCMNCRNLVDCSDYYPGEEYDNDEWRNR